jgi:predicted naringenin-chalcone synthase
MGTYLNPHGACPVDIGETAEAYIMKRLSTADALRFAIHCLTCHECAAAVERAEGFVRAVKVAAQQVRAEAHTKPRICSQATVTKVTTVRPGVVRAKMRFEVTVKRSR